MDCNLPLGKLIVVTGVSGTENPRWSNQTLYPAFAPSPHRSLDEPLPYHRIEGLEYIDKVVDNRPKPHRAGPRAPIPATYIKVFDEIRKLFAKTVEPKYAAINPAVFLQRQRWALPRL